MRPVDKDSQPIKLHLQLDPEQLTVDEVAFLLEPTEFRPSVFREFMGKYSNWTVQQVGKLTMLELREVLAQVGEELRNITAPKASKTASAPGPASPEATFPAGPAS